MKDADKPTDGHAAWKYGAYRQGSIQKLSVGDDRWLRAEPPVLFRSRAPGGKIWEAKPPPPFLKAEHFFILNSRFCFQFCTWTCCVCGKVSWSVTLTNAGGEGYVCTLHPPPWICPAYRFFFVVIKYVKHLQSCVICGCQTSHLWNSHRRRCYSTKQLQAHFRRTRKLPSKYCMDFRYVVNCRNFFSYVLFLSWISSIEFLLLITKLQIIMGNFIVTYKVICEKLHR